MTDIERYERAMRHDFPKDFVSDDEWDFIEAMASCKGDGVKNKSITACRMPQSGGVKNMAKFSLKDKRKHYTDVANGVAPVKADSKFTPEEQRAYARGQRDARNENARIFASQNSTPEEKESWRLKRAEAKVAYLKEKASKKSKKK